MPRVGCRTTCNLKQALKLLNTLRLTVRVNVCVIERHQRVTSCSVLALSRTLHPHSQCIICWQTLTQSAIGGKSRLVTWQDTPDIDWVSHWPHHLLFGKLTLDFFYNSARNAVKILSSFIFAKLSTSNEPPAERSARKRSFRLRGCEIPCSGVYINCGFSLSFDLLQSYFKMGKMAKIKLNSTNFIMISFKLHSRFGFLCICGEIF